MGWLMLYNIHVQIFHYSINIVHHLDIDDKTFYDGPFKRKKKDEKKYSTQSKMCKIFYVPIFYKKLPYACFEQMLHENSSSLFFLLMSQIPLKCQSYKS